MLALTRRRASGPVQMGYVQRSDSVEDRIGNAKGRRGLIALNGDDEFLSAETKDARTEFPGGHLCGRSDGLETVQSPATWP